MTILATFYQKTDVLFGFAVEFWPRGYFSDFMFIICCLILKDPQNFENTRFFSKYEVYHKVNSPGM